MANLWQCDELRYAFWQGDGFPLTPLGPFDTPRVLSWTEHAPTMWMIEKETGIMAASSYDHDMDQDGTMLSPTMPCTVWGLDLPDPTKPTPRGNCLYEAIAHGLRRTRATDDTAASVRHATMTFAWRNRDNCGLMPDDEHTAARYVALQGMDGTPGMGRELALACWAFEVSIVLRVLGVPPMVYNEGQKNPIILEWSNDHFVRIDADFTDRLRKKLTPGLLLGRQGGTAGSCVSRCTSKVTSSASSAPSVKSGAARASRAASSRKDGSRTKAGGTVRSRASSSGAKSGAKTGRARPHASPQRSQRGHR